MKTCVGIRGLVIGLAFLLFLPRMVAAKDLDDWADKVQDSEPDQWTGPPVPSYDAQATSVQSHTHCAVHEHIRTGVQSRLLIHVTDAEWFPDTCWFLNAGSFGRAVASAEWVDSRDVWGKWETVLQYKKLIDFCPKCAESTEVPVKIQMLYVLQPTAISSGEKIDYEETETDESGYDLSLEGKLSGEAEAKVTQEATGTAGGKGKPKVQVKKGVESEASGSAGGKTEGKYETKGTSKHKKSRSVSVCAKYEWIAVGDTVWETVVCPSHPAQGVPVTQKEKEDDSPGTGGPGGPGSGGGGPAKPVDPPSGPGTAASKQPDQPASPLTTLVSPQTGMMVAKVSVTPGKTVRLFDPEVGRKAAAEVRVTEDDDGKVLPFIVGGAALASAGLLIDFGGGGHGGRGGSTGTAGSTGGVGDPVARTLAEGGTTVTEGLVTLDTKDTLTITPDGTTPPLTIQDEKVVGWADTALETRTADGNTVWNYPAKKLAEVADPDGQVVGQTVQYQLNPDEVQAGEHAFVLVDKDGLELARRPVGSVQSTQMSILVVPQDGPPGSPATLQVAASGIMDYYERSVWGGMPSGTTIAIDYSLSGGATGPNSTSVAKLLSLPIKRGATDGQISAQLVCPEGK